MIKRLGIFGGAFDPVHKGHTQSLKYINDLKIIDEIQVIPNYASPHNKDIQTDEKHRLKMLEIAFKEIKNIKLNHIVLKNKNYGYLQSGFVNFFKELLSVPEDNLIVVDEYVKDLQDSGFEVRKFNITDKTFKPYFTNFIKNHTLGVNGGGDDGIISSHLQPPFSSRPGIKYPVRD